MPQLTIREAMVRASNMGARAAGAEKYRWAAVWWRLQARESRNPAGPLAWSRNQWRLYRDMQARPEHYRAKPFGLSDWLWSGLDSEIH